MESTADWLDGFLTSGFEGSDVYLVEGQPPLYRGDDMALRVVDDAPRAQRDEILALFKDQPNAAEIKQILDSHGAVDFAFECGASRIRANVSWQKAKREMRAALRVQKSKIPDLDDIGLPTDWIRKFVNQRSGIILVTGITGSGKSTSLASMLLERAKRPQHIITLENPIEYPLTDIARASDELRSDIQQVEVGVDTPTFSYALRAALRQDPDVILVGEINDSETANLAVRAAETGHLVLGTLHTRSAHMSIENLIDKFPADSHVSLRKTLAEYLVAVVSQILIPTVDGSRALAYEIMTGDKGVSTHIRDNSLHQIPNEMRGGAKYGMNTLNEMLKDLVRKGVIEKETALENTYDRAQYEQSSR